MRHTILLLLCACGAATMKPSERAADLVLVGGTIYTMDPLRPRAEGVAIAGGRVEAVGGDAEIRRRIGPHTRVVELGGGAATPGLVDGHCHLYGLGLALETLPLRGLTSPEAVTAAVREAAARRPPGEWILGRGWDQNLWPVKEFPGRGVLDRVANPVALRRVDGHSLWANAAAMRAAGVTRATPDPAGGRIVRDAAGEPTGVFVDHAMALIDSKVPAPTPDVVRRRLEAAQQAAVAAGLTGVHEMGIPDEIIAVYRALAAEHALKLRVYAFLQGEGHVDTLPARKPDVDRDGSARFVLGGVKLYADGSLGSRSAALLEPYADDPQNRGLVLMTLAELTHAAEVAARAGWQLAVHAIGDRANRTVLDAYAAARVPAERRFRIEHAQVVAPADFARFAAQGVLAAMQPTHATSDMPWAEARLGPERVKGAYAWRTMLNAGVHVVGGSDFPVEEVPPLLGLEAAVARGGWHVEQKLTLDEAIRIYTVEPAFAAFQDGRRGRLAPGYVADVTVFDRDLVDLRDVRVAKTIVGGAVVYER